MALKLLHIDHSDATISARYGHVTPEMISELIELETGLWRESLGGGSSCGPRSSVAILDAALQALDESIDEEAVMPLISQKPPKTSRAHLSD